MRVFFQGHARNAARKFLDAFFPRHCLCCQGHLAVDSPLRYGCEGCMDQFLWIGEAACNQCGGPFEGEVALGRICKQCKERRPLFKAGRSLFRYQGLAAQWVQQLKYHRGRYLIPDIQKLSRKKPEWADFLEESILVPVPLHYSRLRERGYNQSLLLALIWKQLAQKTRVQDILVRTFSTVSQTALSREERLKNVKNAFAIRPKVALDPALTYTIVDDVYTTGATLNACAATLRKGGAKSLQVLTLAHG